jgi:hypothetical protein
VELVNATPLPAKLYVSEFGEEEPRAGALVAKATFRFGDGVTVLERDDPVPVFDADEETELGLLPRDDLPAFERESFQVILLGTARAPRGEAVPALTVALAVGGVQRTMSVWGDRRWEGTGTADDPRRISQPTAFTEMPLTWARAYGGSTDVLIDVDAPLRVSDPRNPEGRGHDPTMTAVELGKTFGAREGYPRWVQERPLPNLEDPRNPIARWRDSPDPYCWATLPLTSGLHAGRLLHLPEDPARSGDAGVAPSATHRAHPDWVVPLPEAGVPVRMHGVDPRGEIAFRLPEIRVLADYVLGDRTGERELRPRLLVLLPDEGRGYLVFRHQFTFPFAEGEERCMRLRLEEGWYTPPPGSSP